MWIDIGTPEEMLCYMQLSTGSSWDKNLYGVINELDIRPLQGMGKRCKKWYQHKTIYSECCILDKGMLKYGDSEDLP